MENEDKTQFTLKHAQLLFQTIADIGAEKYAPNMKIKESDLFEKIR